METIKRKSGLRFREEIRVGLKKIKSPVFTRKSDAKDWKRRMDSEKYHLLAHGKESSFNKPDRLFDVYAQTWLYEIKINDLSPRSFDNYESVIRVHLIPEFKGIKLRELKDSHGREFIKKLKGNHSPKGAADIFTLLKSILKRAKEDKLIIENPFENIKAPVEELTCDAFWTKSEVKQFLLSSYSSEYYPLYFLAVNTGMRMSELCGLCWDRVDFQLNQLTISRTRDKKGLKNTTKSKMKRIIPMTNDVRELLWNLFTKQLNPVFVLAHLNGKKISYSHLYRVFKKSQLAAGLTKFIRFHDLRHTFATQFMMNGGNLFELQKILGHSKIEMTMRYAHFSPEHLKSAVKFMDVGYAPDSPHRKCFEENVFENSMS